MSGTLSYKTEKPSSLHFQAGFNTKYTCCSYTYFICFPFTGAAIPLKGLPLLSQMTAADFGDYHRSAGAWWTTGRTDSPEGGRHRGSNPAYRAPRTSCLPFAPPRYRSQIADVNNLSTRSSRGMTPCRFLLFLQLEESKILQCLRICRGRTGKYFTLLRNAF